MDAICPAAAEPLAVLEACHRRIEKECARLAQLPHLDEPTEVAQQLLRYFDNVGRNHHLEDEEAGLFPLLQRAAGTEVNVLLAELKQQHAEIERAWLALRPEIQRVAESGGGEIAHGSAFVTIYRAHMQREDAELLPLARRVLQDADWEQLAQRMAARKAASKT